MLGGLAIAVISLGACASESKSSSTDAAATVATAAGSAFEQNAATEAPAATDAPAPADAAIGQAAEAQATPPIDVPGGGSPVLAGRDIIFTGTLTLTTPDIQAAATRVAEIVEAAGGAVFSSRVELGEHGHGTITVKLPPRALSATVAQLDTVGEVSGFSQDAQDVTSQMVDLDARILTAAASVDRARAFLEQAANIGELAQLEAELTNRETMLEQLRTHERALGDQVASATLTVELVLPAEQPIIEPTPPKPPSNFLKLRRFTVGEAFDSGWHAFATAAGFVAVVLAIAAPFVATVLLIGIPLVIVVRRRIRRRRARRPATPPPTRPIPPEALADAGAAPAGSTGTAIR